MIILLQFIYLLFTELLRNRFLSDGRGLGWIGGIG